MINSKTLILLALVAFASAEDTHPINHDIVNDIKEKTDIWEPYDPHQNPLKDYSQ